MRQEFLRQLATPSVAAEQVRAYGRSRIPAAGAIEQLPGPEEETFIARRDSFYVASVGETGWPYVQHRGGPPGFVRLISPRQLAWADFGGNRQLISAGNLRARRRVALFFMDYPARERLKVLGEAEVLDADAATEFSAQLAVPPRAVVERYLRVTITAFDWNCPKFITPRFTSAEIEEAVAPLRTRLAELEATLTRHGISVPPFPT